MVYILNTSNEEAAKGNHYTEEVVKYLKTKNYVIMSVALEQESILFDDDVSQK